MRVVLFWLVAIDLVVCILFTVQILFFPSSFLQSAFGGGVQFSSLVKDMTRLLGGIYLSWTIMLGLIVHGNVPLTRMVSFFLLISAALQLPIAGSFEAFTSTFVTINKLALWFWVLAYSLVFLLWK